jgi:hypothetical protein
MTVDEIKVKALKEPDFFKALVLDTENVLNRPELGISDADKATLYLLVKFGTRCFTAEEYLKVDLTRQDTGGKGAWA